MFIPNKDFIEELIKEQDTIGALSKAAKAAAPKAEAFAHHTRPKHGTRRIEVVEEDGEVALVNNNYGAHIEEFGSKNNPAYAPLRRGVRAAGYELRES